MLREHFVGYENSEGVKCAPEAPSTQDEATAMAARLWAASCTLMSPTGLANKIQSQSQMDQWAAKETQQQLYHKREVQAEHILLSALKGDLLDMIKLKLKQGASVFKCWTTLGSKFKNRVSIMLDERHTAVSQGQIHGAKNVGMTEHQRPQDYIMALDKLRCESEDMAAWAERDKDQAYLMSDAAMVKHLLQAWSRTGTYADEMRVSMRAFEHLPPASQTYKKICEMMEKAENDTDRETGRAAPKKQKLHQGGGVFAKKTDGFSGKCWDCGAKGQKAGHDGCPKSLKGGGAPKGKKNAANGKTGRDKYNNRKCRNGSHCPFTDCKFKHPEDWNGGTVSWALTGGAGKGKGGKGKGGHGNTPTHTPAQSDTSAEGGATAAATTTTTPTATPGTPRSVLVTRDLAK